MATGGAAESRESPGTRDRREPEKPAGRLTGMTRALAATVAAAIAWWDLADAVTHSVTPSSVLLAAALAITGLVVIALAVRPARPPATGPRARAAALRARARRCAHVRLRDPAAPGRPCPRAPSPALPAASA